MERMPRRIHDLEITELEEEIVCYLPDVSEGFFLNPTAAKVLKHCDGVTPVADVVKLLPESASAEDLLGLTLNELKQSGLLEEAPFEFRVTRSDFLRKWTVAAALPVITAIMMPTPAQAQSACGGSCGGCTCACSCGQCAACV